MTRRRWRSCTKRKKKQRKIDMQEAAERFKREQEERRQEVAEFKKQMKGLQANALYRT